MPYIHIHWWEGRTPDQKAEIARKITEALVDEGTPRDAIWIRFEDSDPRDWVMGGEQQGTK